VLEEILRLRLPLRPDVLKRWQLEIRQTLGPDLDELDALRAAKTSKQPKKELTNA
jgi:hypothetical protein